MPYVEMSTVMSNSQVEDSIFRIVLSSPQIAENSRAGQFVHLYLNDAGCMLPRPLSICSRNQNLLTFIYRTKGKGTLGLAKSKSGKKIKLLGPLGNGFEIGANIQAPLIIGGGLGIPPLLELAKNLQVQPEVFLGYSHKPFLLNDFRALNVNLHFATINGDLGFQGTILQLLQHKNPDADMIFACGPKKLLQKLTEWACHKKIPIQVSMEERMACGIGACLGCAIKIKTEASDEWDYKKVCKDGPVFIGGEVVWDE